MRKWRKDRYSWITRGILLAALTTLLPIGAAQPIPASAALGSWSGGELDTASVDAVAVHPNDDNLVYAASEETGSLYRSRDGGATWAKNTSGAVGVRPRAIVFAGPSRNIILISAYGGVIRSRDGGATLDDESFFAPSKEVNHLVVSDAQPNLVYASTEAGIYRSLDAGVTWSPMAGGDLAAGEPIQQIAINSAVDTTLLAAGDNAVFSSTDAGVTWTRRSTGLPTNARPRAVLWLEYFYFSSDTYVVYDDGGFYHSSNGGATWSLLNGTDLPDLGVSSVALLVDPTSVGAGVPRFYVTAASSAATGGVYFSPDGGVNWQARRAGLTNRWTYALGLAPGSPHTLFAGTQGGLYRSLDAGVSWSFIGNGFGSAYSGATSLAPDATAPNRIYAGTYQGGVLVSNDGGGHWSRLNNGLDGNAWIGALAIDPGNSQVLYGATRDSDQLLVKTTNGGAGWAHSDTGLAAAGAQAITAIAVDPLNGNNIYLSASRGQAVGTALVFHSPDAGVTWHLVNSGLPSIPGAGAQVQLALDTRAPSTLYVVVGNQVYRSLNGGTSWTPLGAPLASGTYVPIVLLAPDPNQAGRLYAATTDRVYRSDNGSAWQALGGLPYFFSSCGSSSISSLLVDRFVPSTLYASFSGSGGCLQTTAAIAAAPESLVYRSLDGGQTWSPFTAPSGNRGDFTLSALSADLRIPGKIYGATANRVVSIEINSGPLTITQPLMPDTSAFFGNPPFAISSVAGQLYPFDTEATAAGPATLTVSLLAGNGTLYPLTGNASASTPGGTLRFSNLSTTQIGRDFRLIANTTGISQIASQPFDIIPPEQEPNETLATATPIPPLGSIAGWISRADDADWYRLTSSNIGATVAISLTNLPQDYDIALVRDPLLPPTLPVSDGISLANILDASRITPDQTAKTLAPTDAIARITEIGGVAVAQDLLGISAHATSAPEFVTTRLDNAGTYYLLVYSAAGGFDTSRPYRLDATLSGGATPPTGLGATHDVDVTLAPDQSRRTLFVANFDRMAQQYPEEAQQVEQLRAALAATSPLMNATSGVLLDLGSSTGGLDIASYQALQQLYAAWDEADKRSDPLVANRVAEQIWLAIQATLTSVAPRATDLVLVGGDDVIPFYRVIDDAVLGPESQYADELDELMPGALDRNSALGGSLTRSYIQTDNFYADRAPTPWRGRYLFIPDLGTGRLVERPSSILAYLSTSADAGYQVDAASASSAALVTGYDMVQDQAQAIADQLGTFGFNGQRISLLNNNSWTTADLEGIWLGGAASRHQLNSLNGHFSHYALAPANQQSGAFAADQLSQLAPDYFRNSLLYSIGCHAGLIVPAEAFPVVSALQSTFANQILSQGGIWVAPSGYSYADRSTIGYSERLAVLFTHQLGRDLKEGDTYLGAPIGESLTRAKQRYLQSIGAGGLSTIDEKVLLQMTIYGLPTTRVKVPDRIPPPFDDPATAIPQPLQTNAGLLTRVITMTSSFELVPAADPLEPNQNSAGQLVRVSTTIDDSFTANQTILTSTDQMAPGRPVLPLLNYDITLLANSLNPTAAIPEPRGVRLKQATTQPDLDGFTPHVTTALTQETVPAFRTDPLMAIRGLWLPDVPYTYQRTATMVNGEQRLVDQLLVNPTQFNASSGTLGQLRRFSQLVFEVSYADPARADPVILRCGYLCRIKNWFTGSRSNEGGGLAITAVGDGTVRLSTSVTYDPAVGLRAVTATFTTNSIDWRRATMTQDAPGEQGTDGRVTAHYSLVVPAPASGSNIAAFFEAIDNAGNVSVSSGKGAMGALTRLHVPIVQYTTPPDLVVSISVSPDRRQFSVGEPVTINVTVTNRGSSDAGPFWVDLFINPAQPPDAANQIWSQRCGLTPCYGIAWGVASGLKAGQSIVLSSTSPAVDYTRWPGSFAAGTTDLYAYVDSWNPGSAYGAVLESDETNNRAELHGFSVSGGAELQTIVPFDIPRRPTVLP